MLNYHELTMTESKNSPQKKKQFGVVCTVILAGVLYSMLTSGALQAVDPVEGIFPGGHFCYKLVSRDYASSRGLGRSIMEDYKKAELAKQNSDSPSRVPSIEEDLYHVFMDDPKMSIDAFRRRYMTGILVSNKGKDKIKTLMSLNDKEMKKEFSFDEYHDLNAGDIFDKTPYERGELPSVDSLVLQFPFNGGLGSMLVQSHKVRNVFFGKCNFYSTTTTNERIFVSPTLCLLSYIIIDHSPNASSCQREGRERKRSSGYFEL